MVPTSEDPLFTLVLRCQAALVELEQTPPGARQDALRQSSLALNAELFTALAEPLREVARGWRWSDLGRDAAPRDRGQPLSTAAEAFLVDSLFFYILDALPTLKLRQATQLVPYLKRVARNGLFDEDYRVYRGYPPPRRGRTPPRIARLQAPRTNEDSEQEHQEPADPQTLDADSALIAALDRTHCLALIYELWARWPNPDRLIMEARWRHEPRQSFEAIALALGPGWTAEAVRQRHTRAMQRTRDHLRGNGWDEP